MDRRSFLRDAGALLTMPLLGRWPQRRQLKKPGVPDRGSGDWAQYDDTILAIMAERGITCASFALAHEGMILIERAYRHHLTPHDIVPNVFSQYRYASLTKTMTAVLVLLLVRQNLLALDSELGEFVPLGNALDTVTVRQLLSHRSGVGGVDVMEHDLYIGNTYAGGEFPIKPNHILDFLRYEPPLAWAPGSGFHYASVNYFLLGLIVESVTGRPYFEALEHEVLVPLRMTSTRPADSRKLIDNEVYYHTPFFTTSVFNGTSSVNSAYGGYNLENAQASGGMLSCPRDAISLMNGMSTLLGEALYLEAVGSPAGDDDFPSYYNGYGYGLMIDSTRAITHTMHTGSLYGVQSSTVRRKDGVTFSIAMNRRYPWDNIHQMHYALLDLTDMLFGAPPPVSSRWKPQPGRTFPQ